MVVEWGLWGDPEINNAIFKMQIFHLESPLPICSHKIFDRKFAIARFCRRKNDFLGIPWPKTKKNSIASVFRLQREIAEYSAFFGPVRLFDQKSIAIAMEIASVTPLLHLRCAQSCMVSIGLQVRRCVHDDVSDDSKVPFFAKVQRRIAKDKVKPWEG